MIHILLDTYRKISPRRAYMTALFFIIAVTVVTIPRVAPTADTASPSQKALLENKPWRGDFDGIVKERVIRALVVYSKTFYFLDGGRQRGLSYTTLPAA